MEATITGEQTRPIVSEDPTARVIDQKAIAQLRTTILSHDIPPGTREQIRKQIREAAKINIALASNAIKIRFGKERKLTPFETAELLTGKTPATILEHAGIADETLRHHLLKEATDFYLQKQQEIQQTRKSNEKDEERPQLTPEQVALNIRRSQQAAYAPESNPEIPPKYQGKHRKVKPFFGRGRHRKK